MTLQDFQKRKKKLPDEPGVYFFLGPRKEVLYIGKATSLKDRVRSYFSPDLADARGPQIVRMVEKARSIDFRQTDSVLEALILEANLVKTHKPRYNTELKDDKSFNHVVITNEAFPRILLVRAKDLRDPARAKDYTPASVFGPFPHGSQLKEALRIIRKIFPYRDACTPAPETTAAGKKPKRCFNAQIGLCPGVCSGDMDAPEYRKTIRHIRLFFEGRKKMLMRALEREMKAHARAERFEEAAGYRKKLFALKHIEDVSLIKGDYRTPGGVREFRIEAYDIAHTAGGSMVGVMTAVENGEPRPAEYRKFIIRSVAGPNDPAALAEVLSRRLGHDEWRMPQLIAVDGSTAQMNAAGRVLGQYGVGIPVVGVVKDEKHRPREVKALDGCSRALAREHERAILLANSEAHRFAVQYHRRKRGEMFK